MTNIYNGGAQETARAGDAVTHTLRVLLAYPQREESDWVAQCACGWESLPLPWADAASVVVCAVGREAADGARRRAARAAVNRLVDRLRGIA